MLTACAVSPDPKPIGPAPDPVVETRTVREPFCPPEVTAAPPARVPDYSGPPVDVPPDFLAWNGAHFRREALLEQRLTDAGAVCPKER